MVPYLTAHIHWAQENVLLTSHSKDSLDTLGTHRVVHHTEVLARVFHFSFFDDEGASHLLDSVTKFDRALGSRFGQFVPPEEEEKTSKFSFLARIDWTVTRDD